ncbi:MAG: gamma-glutamylcyclotransferase [Anaerolineae bacterium]|nr:gamma-glutamylcyclotransferase [Anaerolineae bacterium]
MNVFTYGSLMYHRVWSRVVAATYPQKSGAVYGFQRLRVKNEPYPGLIKGNDVVDGIIYFGVTTADLARLDKFEGRLYKRVEVEVTGADGEQAPAWVYVIRDEFRELLDGPWSKTEFEQEGLAEFEARYGGFEEG